MISNKLRRIVRCRYGERLAEVPRPVRAAFSSLYARRLMDITTFLAHHGIAAERFEHPPVMTVEESDRLVPHMLGAKTKNMVLRDKIRTRNLILIAPHVIVINLIALGVQLL